MSFLSQNACKPAARKPQVTIFGDAGMGKTSLAATFPRPLFIRAEDGMMSVADLDVTALPLLTTGNDIWKQLQAVLMEEHDFQTLVIDSVSALDRMFTEDMIEEDYQTRRERDSTAKRATINALYGGYGQGWQELAARHQRVKRACDLISAKKGMNIVFLSHADVSQIDLPDQNPYMRYDLRLAKKSAPVYTDGVDVVGFIRLQTMVEGGNEKNGKAPPKAGKAKSYGNRQLIVHATAANVSKNRYGITDPLQFTAGVNPLAFILNTNSEVKE